MCGFFSFCTEPENHGGKRYYFDWTYRKGHYLEECDSHSLICEHYHIKEDICNKYEYNPLTKEFEVDMINSHVDDRVQAEDWVNKKNFKKIVEPLIIKPLINPFELPMVSEPNQEQIKLLKSWASVGASVAASVAASVVASVRDSVWAYASSFFDITYQYDFTPIIELWKQGLVPSFDGKVWRLHSGKKATIVFEITSEELQDLP